jgi:putative SOS response-associated peptidase YedK
MKRCLVVVDGFYEWRQGPSPRQPHLLQRADGAPLVLAGVADDTDGCAIVTVPARGVVSAIHDRMPMVLEREAFAAWLDPRSDVQPLVERASGDALAMAPVGMEVGDVRRDDVSLATPIDGPPPGTTLSLF